MAKHYLLGASGHGKVIADILALTERPVQGFFDDDATLQRVLQYPVLGPIAQAPQHEGAFLISIGNNAIRKKVALQYALHYVIAQHPAAVLDSNVVVGAGTVIMAGVIANSSVKLGEHCILNTACSIDHDCEIDDFVHISPNATLSGNVTVGEGTHIGAGAAVIQGIHIGEWCTIGAGAVIIRDVPAGATVVGNPGRIMK